MTHNQRKVLELWKRGASIEEIAGWLKISPEAVLHRLRSARHHQEKNVIAESKMHDMHQRRCEQEPAGGGNFAMVERL